MESIQSLQNYKAQSIELSLFEVEIKKRVENYNEEEKRAGLLTLYLFDVFLNTKDLSFLEKHSQADSILGRLEDLKTLFQTKSTQGKIIDLVHSFLNTQSDSIIEAFQETDKVLGNIYHLDTFRKIPKTIGRNSGGYLKKDDILFLNDMFGEN